MVRLHKLLFMAIVGIVPHAKMNQQWSRWFRSAQEAKDKVEARKLAVAEWEAMGRIITDDKKSKEAWDSNTITPGTSFMALLAVLLWYYWVVEKMNTDPGWKDVCREHFLGIFLIHFLYSLRRQRTANPSHDPNTQHVIHGLDADLIMLALEDVFVQAKGSGCRICGPEGHYATQSSSTRKKLFIFLNVAILHKYLESELNVNNTPFPFDLEQAIQVDDWVLLIFFVGNNFLLHLPSLEIHEGVIDTLLRIWKMELPRMGGYLMNHGQLVLSHAQIILEGLA
ncbi:XRN 5'-3' exonuclease N-terminus-domain-containing protein [Suillus subaureus]|uniref:XRN 5'-3' exonuclease N-terminus-domain-containing protein n=1 Tax=Suillus subaureus TaxID=48587 RepID=A0A9P7JHV1_9AGAM|nr:XRN 5'-3' exonuclease N-terminus-domain-containing protein [Suillus subaureus]KAG1823886.1 XRN 5'-3' exonuclease N-terminus-domain-containing protein [Suillus subaureus]